MGQTHQLEAAIFDAAMELPPEQRAAHLENACAGDAALRQRLDALLKACETSCGFLDSPATPEAPEPTNVLPHSFEKAGDRIGHYKLLQQIGEGGCGVVYMAGQEEPVSRRVALKVIKLGMDTKSVIARFEAERQALALMDHPNIAKVLDAGATETGRPYFVMELVRGMKITEYCDEVKLSTRGRLDLFIQVCHAIQHAHQKGIIHRDIKPSNILVTVNDGKAVPKVIDFGIAKATGGQKLTNKTVFTAFDQFIGTPAYMSPEQATLTSLDIDTRSDIYALGVLLYELLTGKTPFDAEQLLAIGLDEMRRTIREQEPPKPSTRLTEIVAADARRLTTPGEEKDRASSRRLLQEKERLASELRGDLDWIVMKSLEKDRSRRYETANGLAADIQRHLNNEPVVACPPTTAYRFKKMVRRNKLVFAAGSAVGVSLVVGLTLSTLLFFRERAARQRANEQAAIAQGVRDFLRKDLLWQADSYSQAEEGFTPDPNLTVRTALQRAAERIADRFKDQPLLEAAIRMEIGDALRGIGDVDRAIAHLQRSLELFGARLGPTHPATVAAMGRLAYAYQTSGKLEQALPLYEKTLKLTKARLGPNHLETLDVMNNLAGAYRVAGKLDLALPLFEETVKLRKARLGPENRDTLGSMVNLAMTYGDAGQLDQALPLFEETLKLMKLRLGPDDPYTQNAMDGLAVTYHLAGKFDLALPLFEETLKLRKARLGPDHSQTLHSMDGLASAYQAAGKLNQALPLFEETLKLRKVRLGPDHPDALASMHNLAGTFSMLENYTEAETLYREALNHLRPPSNNAPPLEIPLLGVILHHLADVLRERKMPSEARSFAEEATTVYDRHADWPADERRHALEVLEAVLKDLGDSGGLKAVRIKRAEALRAAAEKDDVDALNTLAWLLATCSDSDIRDGRSAVAFAERAVAKTNPKDPNSLDTLAAAYAEAGEFAKAVTAQRMAIDLSPDEKTKNGFAPRLKLYESNTPFREP